MKLTSHCKDPWPSCDGRQAGFHWDYDRAEIIADGVVHTIGVGLGLVGAVFLLLAAGHSAIGGEVIRERATTPA